VKQATRQTPSHEDDNETEDDDLLPVSEKKAGMKMKMGSDMQL
jgi:hypothetical protein